MNAPARFTDSYDVEAIRRDPGLRLGVNVAGGKVTHPAVAEGVGAEYVPVEDALGAASEATLKAET